MFLFTNIYGQSFKQKQLKYKRVRTAYKEKEEGIKKLLKEKGIIYPNYEMLILGYKQERTLEVWVKKNKDTIFFHLKDYDFCSFSGKLGPKRMRGDLQIPEGFYYISYFNPYSSYYLSLKINYPNRSDRILGKKNKLGNDIFIHGDCCTIGCIPITDDKIKELYVLAVEAKNNGQRRIPVYIFPAEFTYDTLDCLRVHCADFKENLNFWKNLKQGYDYFQKYKKIPYINVKSNGDYIFK